MPILNKDNYKPPFYLPNGHWETIVPSLFRKVKGVAYKRERINTHDQDFLDLDWLTSNQSTDKLLIMAHGLEGSSHRPYVMGMAKLFHQNGFDALAWNCRSCSGEMNRTEKLYHHGYTIDLNTVVEHAISKNYQRIIIAGVSMGGSLTLKYLGENSDQLPKQVKGGVVFSVPVCLTDSVGVIEEKSNRFYKDRFLRKLHKKIAIKSSDYPELFSPEKIAQAKDFYTFDTLFTSQIYGYENAMDFYQKVQSINFIPDIRVPTLLINALNDPLLSDSSYPYQLAENSKYLHLLVTKRGGHVGYLQRNKEFSWAEEQAIMFINSLNI